MHGDQFMTSLPNSQASRTSTGTFSQQSTVVGKSSVPSLLSSESSYLSNETASHQPIAAQAHALPRNEAFRSALTKFRARLSGNELTDFQSTTYEKLCREVLRIQREQENSKNMMNLSRIQSCLEAMNQFGKTIEVFLNISDAVAFVWGPMKFLLLTAANFADSFEILLDAYEQIGEQLPMLREYESLFHESPHMIPALELMYIDILDFHQHALRFFSGKLWKRLFRSMWKDFGTKFGGILKNLRRHKDLVECRATLAQYRTYREDMTSMQSKLEELVAEEQDKKKRSVKEWLAVGSQLETDHTEYREIRKEYPSTGGWILNQEIIKHWMDADVPASPLLWLTGIPGAGKTILASKIVDECKRRTDFRTSYFYCHYENQGANTAVGVLKGLLDQLLEQYPRLLPHCHTKRASSGEPCLRSLQNAKKLFEDFCTTIPKIFIIVDGLDECEPGERKQLLEVFVQVAGDCDTEEPGKLRLLIVSQDQPDIKRMLHSTSVTRIVPRIIPLSAVDNEGDIKTYVRGWVDRIAHKHEPFSEDMAEYLRNLTVANAKGMFLYAKLVMDNLFHQPTRGDLLDAIKEENFPDGLKEAYEKIVRRIKKAYPREWKKAVKLLGWMVCAQRPLTWREMQVALSIDIDTQSLDYEDSHLRMHIYDICGSLVQRSGNRVSLVHHTAKHYLTKCTEDIDQPSVEYELATLCLQYLTFPCFQDDETTDKSTLRRMMLDGHFAFQDYAVAKWFHHVNAFVNSAKDFVKRFETADERDDQLREISLAIDDFILRYNEENFHDGIVNECKDNCRIFEDQDFYDDLVALTSHIYTFQKKGFDARHKISIKDLETALTRNRKLLEDLPSKMKQDELKIFRQFYDDERRYKCTRITCLYFSEGFKDAKSRKRHVNIHDRPFQCEVPDCLGNEGFANSKDLDKHKRSFHPEISDLAEKFNAVTKDRAKATHTCAICGKSFTRKKIVEDHENSHKGKRPHECAECGKAFTRKNDLTRHQRIHERGK